MPIQPTEDKVSIGYRGTEDYRRRLQIAALQRGVKVQSLIDTAVAFYLEHGPAAATLSVEEESVASNG